MQSHWKLYHQNHQEIVREVEREVVLIVAIEVSITIEDDVPEAAHLTTNASEENGHHQEISTSVVRKIRCFYF